MGRVREPPKSRRGDRPGAPFRVAIRAAGGHLDDQRMVCGRRRADHGFRSRRHEKKALGIGLASSGQLLDQWSDLHRENLGDAQVADPRLGVERGKGHRMSRAQRAWRRASRLFRGYAVVRVRSEGRIVASLAFDDGGPINSASAAIVRLDRSSPFPQVVASHFTGGAHCCTVMKVVTFVGGRWEVVNVGEFDSGRPPDRRPERRRLGGAGRQGRQLRLRLRILRRILRSAENLPADQAIASWT